MGSHIGFIGTFVLAEADVPMDPKDRSLGIQVKFWSEGSERSLEIADERLHGKFDVLLILLLVLLQILTKKHLRYLTGLNNDE